MAEILRENLELAVGILKNKIVDEKTGSDDILKCSKAIVNLTNAIYALQEIEIKGAEALNK
jgi:hypothetical protein